MKDNSKRLIEVFQYINKVSIKEGSLLTEQGKESYLRRLNESHYTGVYHKLVEHFSAHNKLSGNLREDSEYLKEFSVLLEEEDFDPFGYLQKTDKIDEKEDCVLTISDANAKLNHPSISLPAGYTCPFADKCKTFVKRDGSKFASSGINVSDQGDIRCFAASMESRLPDVRNSRWSNFDLIQKFKGDLDGMVRLIERSLDYYGTISLFRIHVSGDFYTQEYFDAWLQVSKNNPQILFYAYTTSISFWVSRLGQIPSNFKLVASLGGKQDDLVVSNKLRYAVVVKTVEEAKELKLPIDIDDSFAYNSDQNFALLLHGVQSKEKGLYPQSIKNAKILRDAKLKMKKK